jgi:reverse gyrase
MQFPKTTVQAAIDDVAQFASIEVTYNENNLFVISDNSQCLNEFETRLAARCMQWDNESVDGVELLRVLTDIQGNRTDFRSRYNDEWQARYDIVAV